MNDESPDPNDRGASRSLWMDELVARRTSFLPKQVSVDVCVVGGGIAGLSAAYELALRGSNVILLEDGTLGAGETARTSAHLASALDDGFSSLERLHGKDGARLAAESHMAAIDRIEAIARDAAISCAFRRVDGFLFNGASGTDEHLVRELNAARRAGLPGVELVPASNAGFRRGAAIRFPNQAELHPIAYLDGLARAAERHGAKIVTGVRVERVEDGARPRVLTDSGVTVDARAIIVATNAPIGEAVELPIKQAAYRSYAIGLALPSGAVPHALFWDTEDPYHYVRVAPAAAEREILVVGGEDHRTGEPDEAEARYQRLEAWARARCAAAGARVFAWSGQILEPADGLAFIGRSPGAENVYLVTGDSGHGLTHGTLGGMLLADLVTGQPNPWEKLYDPARRTLRATGEVLSELATTAGHYADWLEAGADSIPLGSGAVVRRGLELVAVYRDEGGACHARSAACPHLGGVVSWNDGEKTWDCPCHGSRFDKYGRVVTGPAAADLALAPPLSTEPPAR